MISNGFVIFDQYARTTMTEVQMQQIQLFNAASGGALVLSAGSHDGDFADKTLYEKIPGLVRRRNPYADTALTEQFLNHLLDTSVKVAAGTIPMRIDEHMFKWIMRDPAEAGTVIGRQLAEDSMADMLNTAILALVTALKNQPEVYADSKSAGSMSLKALLAGARKFGDHATDINVWIMHSTSLHDIYSEALDNSNRLFSFGTVHVVTDGWGRTMIMTDSPALQITDGVSAGVDSFVALGLAPGAALVTQNGDFRSHTETNNGNENIRDTYQAEWSYQLGLRGFAWDKTAGGKAPTNAAIGTATNWDRYSTSFKDLPGVCVESA